MIIEYKPLTIKLILKQLTLVVILSLIILIGLVMRWDFLKYELTEDSFHRWFIAVYTLTTGNYQDPFANKLTISWLPLYDWLVMSILLIGGLYNILLLKLLNILLNFTAVVIFGYYLSKYQSLIDKKRFFVLFIMIMWLNPFYIMISTMVLPEMLALVIAGVLFSFLIYKNSTESNPYLRKSYYIIIIISSLIKIELWLFLILTLIWQIKNNKMKISINNKIIRIQIITLIIGLSWFFVIQLNPIFPFQLVETTSADLQDTSNPGFTISFDRLFQFWIFYFSAVPYLLIGLIFAFYKPYKRFSAIITLTFFLSISIYSLFGFGTPSLRYLSIAIPFMIYETIIAISSFNRQNINFKWFSSLSIDNYSKVLNFLIFFFMMIILLTSSISTINIGKNVAKLNVPGMRAGLFLKNLPQDDTKLIIADSTEAIYYSQLSPAKFVGSIVFFSSIQSSELSENIFHYLQDRIQYLVIVNSSKYFPILLYFPELLIGTSSNRFKLLYNATFWENQYGGPLIFIYKIIN